MAKQQNLSVVFLDRQRLYFYSESLAKKIIHLDFPQNVVKNLEVMQGEELTILIKAFIQYYKINPCKILLLLSKNIYFEKDFNVEKTKLQDSEKQRFLDAVPLERISSKLIDVDQKIKKLIAVNKDILETVTASFKELGFELDTILPEFLLGKETMSKQLFDEQIAKSAVDQADKFKHNSIVVEKKAQRAEKQQDENTKQDQKQQKSKIIFLLPVFFILMAVLIFLLFKNSRMEKSTSNKKITTKSTSFIPLKTSPTLFQNNASVANKQNNKDATLSDQQNNMNPSIKVINGSQMLDTQNTLVEKLQSVHLTNIETEQNSNINTTQTLLLLSKDLPISMKNMVTMEVNKLFPDVSIQEATDTSFDITIIIGKSGM